MEGRDGERGTDRERGRGGEGERGRGGEGEGGGEGGRVKQLLLLIFA